MKTIAVISQKGGAGKTTLALHLAVASEQNGKTAIIVDLDPQASSTSWKDLRQSERPAVVSAQPARLAQILATAQEHGAHLVAIDTAPHSESAALAAARAADLIIIPCRPAILDLRAISGSVDIAKLAKKPACIVFNAVPTRGTLADDAEEAVKVYDIPISPIRLGQRASFVHSLTLGSSALEYEPGGKAAHEIRQLYKWTCRQVGM